jgi:hypothetical protein
VAEVPPYFAANEAPQVESPVLQFCLDRLKPLPSHAVAEWIVGYKTRVRGILFPEKEESFPIPMLRNYEIILCIWRERLEVDGIVDARPGPEPLVDIASLISKDIQRGFRKSGRYSEYLRYNVVIPTLLRILNHILLILQGQYVPTEDDMGLWVDSCVSILPYVQPRINPAAILPSLSAKRSLDDLCVYPPKEILINSLLSIESTDWGELSFDGAGILCGNETGISERLAKEVSNNLASLLGLPCSEPSRCTNAGIIRSLDTRRVAQAVQSRFFGQDREETMKQRTESKVILGRRVERLVQPLDNKVYNADPSVIPTLLNFVTLLNDKERESTSELVTNLVPCCLELVDSANLVHSALGLAALAHMLVVLDSSNLAWPKVEGDILSKLEDAIRCHRQGLVVLVIGHSHHVILQRLNVSGKVHASFCRLWIANLFQVANRSSSGTRWELLVGGIIPSLHILAKLPDARGMEVGRLGLSVLLPMAKGDFVDARTQFAATVALINLMVSAHPIMHHHGGKIICHLLSAWSHRMADESMESQVCRCLTMHAAAICTVLCGASVQEITDAVETGKEKYQGSFLEMLSQIQSLAVTLSG